MGDTAMEQAQAQVESVVALMSALGQASETNEPQDLDGELLTEDQLYTRVYETPLSVEYRSAWCTELGQLSEPDECRVVLCTGGPHVELRAGLNQYGGPRDDVRVLYQDWFEPLSQLYISGAEVRDALERFMTAVAGGF